MYEYVVRGKNIFEHPDQFACALIRGCRAEIEISNRDSSHDIYKSEVVRRWASVLFKHRFKSELNKYEHHVYAREVVEFNMHWFEYPKGKNNKSYPFIFKQYESKQYDIGSMF